MVKALAQFTSRQAFLDEYLPEKAAMIVADERNCVMGDSPTLLVADKAWGPGTAMLLLASQLYALNEYTNATVKLTPKQARECAGAILSDPDYQALKASEVVLFFVRLKAGHFGHFYNAVDTMHITAALKDFTRDLTTQRNRWIEQEESAKREAEQREHDKVYLRPEQWREWKRNYPARMAQQDADNQ